MKATNKIELITDTYEEQQFILSRFPDSFWFVEEENKTRFYICKSKENDVDSAIREWRALK